MYFFRFSCLIICLLGSLYGSAQKESLSQSIDLSGVWQFLSDSENKISEGSVPSEYTEQIMLPGTMDTNKKGPLNNNDKETARLSRIYKFVGKAWYHREVIIPNNWKDKNIYLSLERTKPTQIWVDGKWIGRNNDISTTQTYDLTASLTPGKHDIVIMVDNSGGVPHQVINSSHAYSEDTQTNWNGILGKILLEAKNKVHFKSIQVVPDIHRKTAKVYVEINHAEDLNKKSKLTIQAYTTGRKGRKISKEMAIPLQKDVEKYIVEYEMGEEAQLWSEFSPILYDLNISIRGKDNRNIRFALRDFKAEGTQFTINGRTTFLRGKHEAAVFPLNGYPPMDVNGWTKYFNILQEYGINYVRFHSWCPPDAAFTAADEKGFYLQPELPIWGSLKAKDTALLHFLKKEGRNIVKQYANHPSFVMFALGNELSGEIDVMKDLVEDFRTINKEILFAYGSNNFLGFNGQVPGEDFLTTCRIGAGENYITDVRASFSFADEPQGGIMNNTYPNSEHNFSDAVSKSTVPVISHETGQYQIYPDYDQIKKYTRILKPLNLEIFKERLENAGMGDQAKDFAKASGRWASLLYKADIEMELRTKEIGGFQLLDLVDYPGQGSAYVGILDAFMDNKGVMSAEEWRNFCNQVVPLFSIKKLTWINDEILTGKVEIANYSSLGLYGKTLNWGLIDAANQQVIKEGTFSIQDNKIGVLGVGSVAIDLSSIREPKKVFFTMNISGTSYQNKQVLWVYPSENTEPYNYKGIYTSKRIDEKVVQVLKGGGDVLLFPDSEIYKKVTIGGLFQTDYWNYRMFKGICENIGKPVSPGTLGILTDPDLPIFKEFPTDFHTNWQWYSVIKNSYPLIMDGLPSSYKPLVQVIDNVERNHKLGLIFEFKIDNGRLLVCMADLSAADDKPEVRQLYKSILSYMQSEDFKPKFSISDGALKDLFNNEVNTKEIKGVNNISY